MQDLELITVILIFILVYMRYKTNNGMWNVIAGVLALALTVLIAQHQHDLLLAIGTGIMSGYLFYDGLYK